MKDDSFDPRPFAALNPAAFPLRKPESRSSEEEEFLRAMTALRDSSAQKKERGFLLKDQCALPRLDARADKKRATAIEPAGPTIEAAAPARARPPDDDASAFLLAARGAAPLGGKGRSVAPKPGGARSRQPADPAFAALLEENLDFAVISSDEYMEGRVSGLDERIMNRLRSGSLSCEAHLDLHGLNSVQAFETLRAFIREAWFRDARVVLIVHGRGKNSPFGQGVLRRKLQSWLAQDPFKRVVLAFCTALPADGGPGSVYVLLRKRKKKGKVYWDRTPADADLY